MQRRLWLFLPILLLFARALIPAGYMLAAPDEGLFALAMCDGSGVADPHATTGNSNPHGRAPDGSVPTGTATATSPAPHGMHGMRHTREMALATNRAHEGWQPRRNSSPHRPAPGRATRTTDASFSGAVRPPAAMHQDAHDRGADSQAPPAEPALRSAGGHGDHGDHVGHVGQGGRDTAGGEVQHGPPGSHAGHGGHSGAGGQHESPCPFWASLFIALGALLLSIWLTSRPGRAGRHRPPAIAVPRLRRDPAQRGARAPPVHLGSTACCGA